ncbi:MAG: MATE family efflux transporter [Bacillota bacterium]
MGKENPAAAAARAPAAVPQLPPQPLPIRREIFRLAWPAILEMCLHMGVWMFDVAMVGRLGANALSATAVAGQIYWALIFLVAGIGVALTAVVSRLYGAGETREAERVGAQGLFLALVAGSLIGLVVWLGADALFGITGLGPEARANGVTYARIVCRGAPFVICGMALSGVLRGFGDTRTPMLVTAFVNLLNIVGDYLLIFGHLGFPALGVRGAALASVTAQATGAALLVFLLASGRLRARLDLAEVLRPRWETARRILRLAVPASLESLFTDLARTFGVLAVTSLGAVSMAAYEVTATTEALSFMPGYGFAIAATVLVGQSLGSGDPARARLAVGASARMALVFMGSLGVLFFLFPRPLVSIFTNDPAIIEVAARCLRVAAIGQPFMALQTVYVGALRGAGDTRTPMIIAGVTSWGCRLTLTYLVIFFFRLPVEWVWGVMNLDWALKLVWVRRAYRRGRWQSLAV